MTWSGGDGWGWCGLIFNVLVIAAFWGATIVLAAHFVIRERRNLPATALVGSSRAEGVAAARFARDETDDDDFYRRLM
jgi:uncharacterized membrane protein